MFFFLRCFDIFCLLLENLRKISKNHIQQQHFLRFFVTLFQYMLLEIHKHSLVKSVSTTFSDRCRRPHYLTSMGPMGNGRPVTSIPTTLPETNIFAPKNGWLEYYFPIGFRPMFRGKLAVSFRECN